MACRVNRLPLRYFATAAHQQQTSLDLWNNLSSFYYKFGDVMYEKVSQTEHAIQSATLAYNESGDATLSIGAFLHDIGHLIEYELKGADPFISIDRKHEQIGYDYMLHELGIKNEKILHSTLYHVDAKRYLCFVDSTYYDGLSECSKQTLILQGGPFSEAEAKQFEQIPFYQEAVLVRKCDDEAKMLDPQIPIMSMDEVKQMFLSIDINELVS
mmetsp:Transcript_73607/g.117346  ORF Transcript_73607/g.117346 Transcript_73607/m.117346 type:complete len:213 (+) Transcript_73607:74-712(+)|eukprot:CAMPEP_0197031568 /NCGR_PEP_ID=MMETSP1384-20130603/10539_1 /TAXON_ID=29189 /ORGANISM="Ammonia sp." /LENGTH=212 /DNA_ID=CAMNT_0042461111 /DNA_START=68 /DNA_END=706 /DNA_ORIENTATION=-